MKYPSNLEEVCKLAPDYVGFIFFRGSSRYVGDHPDPALFRIPGDHVSRVGVFVNEPLLSVMRIIGNGSLDMVQMHGNETPEYCKALVNEGIHVVKAADPGIMQGADNLKAYYGVVHYFLFDTPDQGHGGTGRKFNWEQLDGYSIPVPYFLSGGIGPGDAPVVRKMDNMWLHGVDVNSRFEVSPGMKNRSLLGDFIEEIRK